LYDFKINLKKKLIHYLNFIQKIFLETFMIIFNFSQKIQTATELKTSLNILPPDLKALLKQTAPDQAEEKSV